MIASPCLFFCPRLKFPNKSVSGHCLSRMYFLSMDHFYDLSLSYLWVSSFLLQVVAPRTEYNVFDIHWAGDIMTHWNSFVCVKEGWIWSCKICFPGLVPPLICLALHTGPLIIPFGSSFLSGKWKLLFPPWLLRRDGARTEWGGSYESALEKLKCLHKRELLLMKGSFKNSDHLPNLHFSRAKNAFLNHACTLFHRIFLIITLRDFIRAVTINFIAVCCTRSAFKILIAPFGLKTAGGVYNWFSFIHKAQTKACQKVTHFIKRLLLGQIHPYYLITGRNYVWILHLRTYAFVHIWSLGHHVKYMEVCTNWFLRSFVAQTF